MTAGAKIQIAGASSSSGNATSIQGTPVSATPPQPGNVLTDVAGTWTPQAPASSGAMTQIANQVLASAAASVTFSAIPQTFNHLQVLASLASASAAQGDQVVVRLNASATTYQNLILSANGAVVASTNHNAANALTSGIADIPGATAVAGVMGSVNIQIPNYTGAVLFKAVKMETGYFDGNAGFDVHMRSSWNTAAAITSITFTTVIAANFIAGSAFYLYGVT